MPRRRKYGPHFVGRLEPTIPTPAGPGPPNRWRRSTKPGGCWAIPALRRAYDRSLDVQERLSPRPSSASSGRRSPGPPPESSFPWRFLAGLAGCRHRHRAVGVFTYEPSEPGPPDNVLQAGSCVVIEDNGDAVGSELRHRSRWSGREPARRPTICARPSSNRIATARVSVSCASVSTDDRHATLGTTGREDGSAPLLVFRHCTGV